VRGLKGTSSNQERRSKRVYGGDYWDRRSETVGPHKKPQTTEEEGSESPRNFSLRDRANILEKGQGLSRRMGGGEGIGRW